MTHANVDAAVVKNILRQAGLCGESDKDGKLSCLLEADHAGPHGWAVDDRVAQADSSSEMPEYPTRCECPFPGCRQMVEVVGGPGATRVLARHPINVDQQERGYAPTRGYYSHGTTTIHYVCPASGAVVSPWRKM